MKFIVIKALNNLVLKIMTVHTLEPGLHACWPSSLTAELRP